MTSVTGCGFVPDVTAQPQQRAAQQVPTGQQVPTVQQNFQNSNPFACAGVGAGLASSQQGPYIQGSLPHAQAVPAGTPSLIPGLSVGGLQMGASMFQGGFGTAPPAAAQYNIGTPNGNAGWQLVVKN